MPQLSMVKLSIIIPVYNVEPFVEKCLRSCANQDISSSEYEIIVINDGTKDNSLQICERVAQDYDNIKIVSQENAGLSAARNKGISLAQGDYVWFIDSDDWIDKNCLGEIISRLYEQDLDALLISAARVTDGIVARRSSRPELDGGVFSGIDLLKKGTWEYCAQFTLYKKQFLLMQNLNFMVGIFHEDTEFTPRAYFYAERISIIDRIIYYSFTNPNSIIQTVNPKKAFDNILVAESLSSFEKKVPNDIKNIYNNIISIVVNNGLKNLEYSKDKELKKKLCEFVYKRRSLYSNFTRSSKSKYRIEGFLFKLFPRKSLQVYNFIRCFNK